MRGGFNRRRRSAGLAPAAVSADRRTISGTRVKPGSQVAVYNADTLAALGNAAADGTGAWSLTLGSALAAGTRIGFDGVLAGPVATAPAEALGPATAGFAASAAAGSLVATLTGLQSGETATAIAPDDGRLAIAGGGLTLVKGATASAAGTTAYTVGTSLGRTLGLAVTVTAGAAATLRHVATRASIPTTRSTTNLQIMSRTGHQNRAGQQVTALQIGIPNWYATTGGSGEQSSGGTATFTASVEYPAGTYTQVTFDGGAVSGAAAANTTRMSDTVTLAQPLPDDATFWVNIYGVFASGSVYTFKFDASHGDRGRAGASVPDSTLASFANSSSIVLPPCLILGQGAKPATMILGDSRVAGTGGSAPERGEIVPSLHPSRPYFNGGVFGAGASQATTARRQEMAAWFQNLVFQLGINDVTAGTTLAGHQGVVANMRGRSGFSGKKMILTTKPPVSTSTDNWATLANQTTHASNAVRVQINDWVRTDPYGEGYFEIADVVESARNSGLWAVNGAANFYNADGTHENDAGYEAIRASGAVGPALLG